MMGVSGLAGDPGVSAGRDPTDAATAAWPLCARLAKAMNRLGWHWWPSDTAVATVGLRRAGALHQSRPLHTRLRARVEGEHGHHLLAGGARRAGVELRTHCRVREITTNEHGMAAGVVYYDADGIEQFQAAEVVVLACNGVGTPRLLLNSASGQSPNGLANSSGLVGQNLMFHPYAQL